MRAAGPSILVSLLLSSAVPASEPVADFRPISDFHRARWTTEEGAPAETWVMAQTPDGWLWLGGAQGLFRFDGVDFEPVQPAGRDPKASTAVYTLLAEDAGDLWVGYLYGGVTHISKGSMRHYGEADGLPVATILSLARDADGVLWAASSASLMRFDGKRWNRVGVESGFTDRFAYSLESDGSGALWVMGAQYLFRRRAHEQRFERTDRKIGTTAAYLTRSADGSLWYEDPIGLYRLPDQITGVARPVHANARRSLSSLFDGEGHLWSTAERSIVRIRAPKDAAQFRFADATVTRLPARDDATDENVMGILEDQEGNIWVITRGGVERFRHTNVRRLKLGAADGTAQFALAAGDGVLWIGQDTGGYRADLDGLWRFDGRLTQVAPEQIKAITAVNRAANGTLWVAGAEGVWRSEPDGDFIKLPDLPGEAAGRLVQALMVDAAGNPWVSPVQADLYQFNNGRWQPNGGKTGLPSQRVVSHARDPDGHLWFGYRENLLARVAADRVTIYGEQQGLQLGVIGAIHVGRFTTVAGERAIALFDGQRFHSVTAEDSTALEGVTGIAEALDGDLWLNGFRGLVRIARQDLEEASRTRSYRVPVEIFDTPDGFPGLAQRVRPLPTLIQDEDGRLWFAGTLGVGWLRPEEVRRNAMRPPIHIRSMVSGGKTYPITDSVKLPVGVHDLEISYTALSLSRPERIRFRYRLEGYDDAWIEAGSRRQAFYTNLPPGDYRFQVIAANESGVWNETGASVNLAIAPTFVQTRTFLVLCVLAGALLIWAATVLRVKQLTARERGRLEERLGERERIARELHDTLLQGVQGLILRLQTTVDQADVSDEARMAMNDALDRADSLLGEGRDRVKNLRSTSTEPQTLKQALLLAAEHMSVREHARLRILENGTPRELHPIVREETTRIAIEAMSNALRHAQAQSIEVELSYGRRALRINVKDDGRGMDASVVSEGREGHFGFMGMKERAKRIRGQLSIWSRPGAGTEVHLRVPARMAYVRLDWKKRFARMLSRPSLASSERSRSTSS